MDYSLIKFIHVLTVLLSGAMFLLRFAGNMFDIEKIKSARVLKFLPHINDTVLLISAIVLAVKLGVSPGGTPWLLAKIIALLLYIVLGSIALKRGKTKRTRLIAGLFAIAIFIYIISVALTKNILVF